MRSRLLPLVVATWILASAGAAYAGRPGGGESYHAAPAPTGATGGAPRPIVVGPPARDVSTGTGSPAGAIVVGVIIAAVVLLVVVQQQRRARRGPRADQLDAAAGQRVSASLDPLRARDPQLTEESIVGHVRAMSAILQAAWCTGDMTPARPFVSDGVYGRFRTQLALMKQENRRDVMSDARVLYATIEAVEDAPPLDVVHVRLTAQARDTQVPWTATQAQIDVALGAVQANPYTEIWTLVRKSGAQSKDEGFQVGAACPGCGAPLGGGEVVKCRYCGALVCSGENDWVLAEITQLAEWRPTAKRPAGIDDLRASDPGVAAEALEDRASWVFWKWIEAGRAEQPAPLRRFATTALLTSGADFEASRGAVDVSVGGAGIVACTVGAPDGFDHVDVRILWSARFGGSADYTPRQTVLRLMRRTGVTSPLSMTALVCPACGAPLSETTSPACEHCGAGLTAGDGAWVLEAVT